MARTLKLTQDREIDDNTLMQFEKGWLWEEALSRAFGEKAAVRPDEIELDGIIGSPDGVIVVYDYNDEPIDVILEEYKCTALSCTNTSPADIWTWMMQVKGYCKMLKTNGCIFRVLHHMDIMWHPEKCYAVWEITFTQRELDENWEAILNHAKTMEISNGNTANQEV